MTLTTIGAIANIFDGPHATPTRTTVGPYFLNISSLSKGRLDLSQSDHVSTDEFAQWTKRVTPRPNDLLFSYETRLGEAALMPEGITACLGRRMALLRFDPKVVNARYFLYYFLSPGFQRLINSRAIHGATVNRIALSSMANWPVDLPPLHTQKAIAGVLESLDAKSEIDGKLSAIASNLATSMYSDAVQKSSVKRRLSDVAVHKPGKHLPRESYREGGGYIVYGSNSVMGSHNDFLYHGPFSVLSRIGSNCGNLAWSEEDAWVNNNASAIMARNGMNPWIVRHALESINMMPFRAGSGQPYISISSLMSAPIILPASNAVASDLKILSALSKNINHESERLNNLRDDLLPPLLSGDIDVDDAEKHVSAII